MLGNCDFISHIPFRNSEAHLKVIFGSSSRLLSRRKKLWNGLSRPKSKSIVCLDDSLVVDIQIPVHHISSWLCPYVEVPRVIGCFHPNHIADFKRKPWKAGKHAIHHCCCVVLLSASIHVPRGRYDSGRSVGELWSRNRTSLEEGLLLLRGGDFAQQLCRLVEAAPRFNCARGGIDYRRRVESFDQEVEVEARDAKLVPANALRRVFHSNLTSEISSSTTNDHSPIDIPPRQLSKIVRSHSNLFRTDRKSVV